MEYDGYNATAAHLATAKMILIALLCAMWVLYLLVRILSDQQKIIRTMGLALCSSYPIPKQKPSVDPVSCSTATVASTPAPLPMDVSAPVARTEDQTANT